MNIFPSLLFDDYPSLKKTDYLSKNSTEMQVKG